VLHDAIDVNPIDFTELNVKYFFLYGIKQSATAEIC